MNVSMGYLLGIYDGWFLVVDVLAVPHCIRAGRTPVAGC